MRVNRSTGLTPAERAKAWRDRRREEQVAAVSNENQFGNKRGYYASEAGKAVLDSRITLVGDRPRCFYCLRPVKVCECGGAAGVVDPCEELRLA